MLSKNIALLGARDLKFETYTCVYFISITVIGKIATFIEAWKSENAVSGILDIDLVEKQEIGNFERRFALITQDQKAMTDISTPIAGVKKSGTPEYSRVFKLLMRYLRLEIAYIHIYTRFHHPRLKGSGGYIPAHRGARQTTKI